MDARQIELETRLVIRLVILSEKDVTAVMAVGAWCIGFVLKLHYAAISSIGHLANA